MIRQSLGLVMVGALLGASATYGTVTQAQAPGARGQAPGARGQAPGARGLAPGTKAYKGVVTPIGPYSPGVGAGGTVYLSGQIGLDPATGNLVEGGTEAQARRVMQNLGAVLDEAGLGYGHVVKATIYMVDLAEFAKVNEIYGSFFPAGGVAPARSTVQVAALPRGARIEIDFVAVR